MLDSATTQSFERLLDAAATDAEEIVDTNTREMAIAELVGVMASSGRIESALELSESLHQETESEEEELIDLIRPSFTPRQDWARDMIATAMANRGEVEAAEALAQQCKGSENGHALACTRIGLGSAG